MRLHVSTILIVLGALPGPLLGQLAPGTRVRVTMEGWRLKPAVGTLESADRDTIRIRAPDSAIATSIPREYVTKLEISRGMQPNVARGMIAGASLGAGWGVFAGIAAPPRRSECGEIQVGTFWGLPVVMAAQCPPTVKSVTVSALKWAMIGAVAGLVGGAMSSGERWERVPLPRLNVEAVSGADGRLGLGISFRF